MAQRLTPNQKAFHDELSRLMADIHDIERDGGIVPDMYKNIETPTRIYKKDIEELQSYTRDYIESVSLGSNAYTGEVYDTYEEGLEATRESQLEMTSAGWMTSDLLNSAESILVETNVVISNFVASISQYRNAVLYAPTVEWLYNQVAVFGADAVADALEHALEVGYITPREIMYSEEGNREFITTVSAYLGWTSKDIERYYANRGMIDYEEVEDMQDE